MIILANLRPANFLKSKRLMAQLETTTRQYMRCPGPFFAMHLKDLCSLFNIQNVIVRSAA